MQKDETLYCFALDFLFYWFLLKWTVTKGDICKKKTNRKK